MQERQPSPEGLAKTVMFQGTASDVGKSVLVTAFCRILAQDGFHVAPFKAQNMSNNAYVTWDGREISHAQGLQAEAAGILAEPEMNPILLKPTGNQHSQVVLLGRAVGNWQARQYREAFYDKASRVVRESLDKLRREYQCVVLEGAGSPAEVNLKDRDLANMMAAVWAEAPVILVADIDRGGAFAAIVGTLDILTLQERERVKGFIINRFRGDASLLKPGLDWLEARTGKPVLGVIPYIETLNIEAEDGVVLERGRTPLAGHGINLRTSLRASQPTSAAPGAPAVDRLPPVLDIALIRLPRIANFTDFAPLEVEPDTMVRYIERVEELGHPDLLIIPGSKSTMADLQHLRAGGWEQVIHNYVGSGKGWLLGFCGGYQMLGKVLMDPMGVESPAGTVVPGLGLLPMVTEFTREKRTVRVSGVVKTLHPEWQTLNGLPVCGYEIHMGISKGETIPLFQVSPVSYPRIHSQAAIYGEGPANEKSAIEEGGAFTAAHGVDAGGFICAASVAHAKGTVPGTSASNGHGDEKGGAHAEGAIHPGKKVWGTYLHGLFYDDAFRTAWLNRLREEKGLPPPAHRVSYRELKARAFDRLADAVRSHVNMPLFYDILGIEKNQHFF